MSLFGIILALVAGFIGSKLINKKGSNLLVDMVVGMVGALVAGFIFTKADVLGITLTNVYSLGVGILGAVIILFTYHKVLKH